VSTQPINAIAHADVGALTATLAGGTLAVGAVSVVPIARLFKIVREDQSHGQNHGSRVNGIQRWSGGQDGDSYCCEFATMVLDLAYQANAPIPRCGACQDVYALAKAKGWIVTVPVDGDLFVFVNTATGKAHHIGIVSDASASPPDGIAGNTSADGKSSNGDGVHEHGIVPPAGSHVEYIHYQASA
jgi:hypothetical protein